MDSKDIEVFKNRATHLKSLCFQLWGEDPNRIEYQILQLIEDILDVVPYTEVEDTDGSADTVDTILEE